MRNSIICAIILTVFSLKLMSTEAPKDSLWRSINHAKRDTNLVNSYLKLFSIYSNEGNVDSAYYVVREGYNTASLIKFKKGEGSALANIGRFYYERGNHDSSIYYFDKAINLFKLIGAKYQEAKAILGNAPNYSAKGDVKKSLSLNLQALTILESVKEEYEVARAYSNIGNLYEKLDKRDIAIDYFKKSIDLSRKIGNKKQLGTALYNLSRSYIALENFKQAALALDEAYQIFKSIKYKTGLSYVVQNLALCAVENGDYKKGELIYREGIQLAIENQDQNVLAYSYGGLADINIKTKKYLLAIENVGTAYKLAEEMGNLELMTNLQKLKAEAYYELADYKKSVDTYTLYAKLNDSLYQNNSDEQMAEMQTKYDTERKEQENKLLVSQNELSKETIKRQQFTVSAIVAGLSLAIGLLFFIFRGLQAQKKANVIIEKQKQETENQRQLVEEKNKEITDSIVYAKRIQTAILTNENYIKRYLKEFFILFKPKDIVSGDFYWCYHENGKTLFVTADCTGHGVPGAMMSMLGVNLLNEIICERKIFQPDQVLNTLRKEIIKALNPEDSNEDAKDGMDCTLIVIDHNNNKLLYSAANNGLYIIRNKDLIEFKADKMPVGKSANDGVTFKVTEIDLFKNDLIIMLTDGYADQFGGEKGKKFKYKQLEELLVEYSHLEPNEIKHKLDFEIENWKGNLEQVDDICVIGVRV